MVFHSENHAISAMIRANNDSRARSEERPKDSESARINCNGNRRREGREGREGGREGDE